MKQRQRFRVGPQGKTILRVMAEVGRPMKPVDLLPEVQVKANTREHKAVAVSSIRQTIRALAELELVEAAGFSRGRWRLTEAGINYAEQEIG